MPSAWDSATASSGEIAFSPSMTVFHPWRPLLTLTLESVRPVRLRRSNSVLCVLGFASDLEMCGFSWEFNTAGLSEEDSTAGCLWALSLLLVVVLVLVLVLGVVAVLRVAVSGLAAGFLAVEDAAAGAATATGAFGAAAAILSSSQRALKRLMDTPVEDMTPVVHSSRGPTSLQNWGWIL